MTPIVAAVAEAAMDAEREAIRAALAAASGNVRSTAVALRCARATLDRRINSLGLRDWLTATYSRSVRQPRRVTAAT